MSVALPKPDNLNIILPGDLKMVHVYENGEASYKNFYYVKDHLGSQLHMDKTLGFCRTVAIKQLNLIVTGVTNEIQYLLDLTTAMTTEDRTVVTGKDFGIEMDYDISSQGALPNTSAVSNGPDNPDVYTSIGIKSDGYFAGVGMFYFGVRYYDAEIGIFTSTDPVDAFWFAYSYTGGNPICFIDPYGRDIIAPKSEEELSMWNEMCTEANADWLLQFHEPGVDWTITEINGLYGEIQLANFNNMMTMNDSPVMRNVVAPAILSGMDIVGNFVPPVELAYYLSNTAYTEINYAIEQRLYGKGNDLSRWASYGTMGFSFGFGKVVKYGAAQNAKLFGATAKDEKIINIGLSIWESMFNLVPVAASRK